MLNRMTYDADHIYLAIGATDFRKQINGLVSLVKSEFDINPYMEASVFIFCNRKKNSIKVLRYDKNGFVLSYKKLMDRMKFQWPKDSKSVKEISHQQVEWLLEGLAPPLSHSFSTPSLIAQVMYQKFGLGLPFNRQERDWYRKGLILSRADMAHWTNRCSEEWLRPIYDKIHKKLLKEDPI